MNISHLPELSDLIRSADGFLSDLEQMDSGHGEAVLLRVRYDLTRFEPSLFTALEIPCPAKLITAVEKRRGEFLAGRAMAKAALCLLGLEAQEIPIGPDRAPIWPAGSIGSISHARGHAAAIVMRAGEARHLGADIEAYASPRAQAAIAKIALTDTDRAVLQGYDNLPAAHLAALIFSAKETLFKALYPVVRAHFGFEAASLAAPPEGGRLALRLTRDLHPTLLKGAEFNLCYALRDDFLVTWLISPMCQTDA